MAYPCLLRDSFTPLVWASANSGSLSPTFLITSFWSFTHLLYVISAQTFTSYFLQSLQVFSSTISESLLTIYIFITLNSVFLTQISILGSRITYSTLYSIAPIVRLIGNPNIIQPNLTHNMLFHLNNPHHSPSYLSNKLWCDPWILHFPYFLHPVNHQAGPCNPSLCPSSN